MLTVVIFMKSHSKYASIYLSDAQLVIWAICSSHKLLHILTTNDHYITVPMEWQI